MDVPAVVRRGGLGRWQEGRSSGYFSDRPGRVRHEALRDSFRRDREVVGAVCRMGYGGERRVRAAGLAECAEDDDRLKYVGHGLQAVPPGRPKGRPLRTTYYYVLHTTCSRRDDLKSSPTYDYVLRTTCS